MPRLTRFLSLPLLVTLSFFIFSTPLLAACTTEASYQEGTATIEVFAPESDLEGAHIEIACTYKTSFINMILETFGVEIPPTSPCITADSNPNLYNLLAPIGLADPPQTAEITELDCREGQCYTRLELSGYNPDAYDWKYLVVGGNGATLCEIGTVSPWPPLNVLDSESGGVFERYATDYFSRFSPLITCPTGEQGVHTALGCFPYDLKESTFFKRTINLGLGLGGALALLLTLYGFFVISTSAGIPDKVKAGQEIITSAVSGLILIILAVVLLNIIGVQILRLPGF